MADLPKKQQELIDEGLKVSKALKISEARLEEIKGLLDVLPVGTHVTRAKSVLVITAKDYYTAPTPEVLLAELKKNKQTALFPKCVNVIKKSCDAILGEATFLKLRKFSKSGKSFSFK